MTETEYAAFIEGERRAARKHLELLLSDECERLGWRRREWEWLQFDAAVKRIGTALMDFRDRTRRFVSENAVGFKRLSESVAYKPRWKTLVWPDGTVDRVIGDIETCLRGAGVESHVTVQLSSDNESKGSVSFDHLRDDRNPQAMARVTALTGACLVIVGPAVFEDPS